MQAELNAPKVCPNCGSNQSIDYKFCNKCGFPNPEIVSSEEKNDEKYKENIKYLSIYAIFSIILLLVVELTEDSLEILLIWTFLFAFIDLVFAFLQPDVWTLFDLKHIEHKPLISIVVIGITTGFIVSISMDNLNLLLFEETYSYMPLFKESGNPLLMALIVIAVCPALFEELAFRGFIFNNLENIAGKKSAMWGSSFLFGLVHFSLFSLIWIIPFGLLLSYYRNKYSTVIYGIIGHFIHNATAILIEHYRIC